MRSRTKQIVLTALLVAMTTTVTSSGLTASAQQRSYGVSEVEVDRLLSRIETRWDQFRRSLDSDFNRTRTSDNMSGQLTAFEVASRRLRERFRQRSDGPSDVRDLLTQAGSIDRYVRSRRVDGPVTQQWNLLRSDLDSLARYYSVSWSWDDRTDQRPPGVNEVEVNRLLFRMQGRWSQFRRTLDSDFNRTRTSNNLNSQLTAFEEASRRFREQLRQRSEGPNDVRDLLTQAGSIDSYVRSRRLDGPVTTQWNLLRSDLDSLARYYTVAWRWDDRTYPGYPGQGNRAANMLTGTYRLDPSRSDDIPAVIRRETRSLPQQQQERLARRLDSPEALAIARQGRNITVASSRAPQVTFEADGRTRTEQTPRGRTVSVSAALLGDQLVVSQTGERGNEFKVTFDPTDNGQRLNVTRQIDVEGLSRPVLVRSSYERTSETAQFDIYREVPSPVPTPGVGDFVMRDGTQLIARLNEPLDTSRVRQGDRFSMTIQSPPQYAGAVIEGYVAQVTRSGRLTGRSELALNFERIRLRDGASYPFEGYIESARSPNGETVRVDNEGVIAERNGQTTQTLTRGGIGAALGAVIGAIAGGGKGAAIGAALGAGAGAGSVFIQGRDDLSLASGTEFTIHANTPRYRGDSGR
ncbi:MAG TPA: hypothetical protein VGV87_10755 [Blastocatellia bacterium]|nr:hypothetical protein [Blastocatellia bacterium]